MEDDWEIPDPQPLKRKLKKAKKNQPVLWLPDESTDYENSEAPLSDCPPETIQSETDRHSESEREESEASFSVHKIQEQPVEPVEEKSIPKPVVKHLTAESKATKSGKLLNFQSSRPIKERRDTLWPNASDFCIGMARAYRPPQQ